MKHYYLLPLVAAFALASCANEDILDETGDKAIGGDAISLNYRVPNSTRGTNEEDLQDIHPDFGVWAAKLYNLNGFGDLNVEKDEKLVMANYLVGYYEENVKGYDANAAGATTIASSNWFYEGLGKDYTASAPYFTSSPSVNPEQFLKYWDDSYPNTFFLAYAPYIGGDDTPELSITTEKLPKLQFNNTISISDDKGDELMYAKECVGKANYRQEVELQFHRLVSKIDFAFWEDIPGYKVELESIEYGGNEYGVWAIPAIQGAYNDETKKHAYTAGHFVNSGIPAITVAVTPTGTDKIAYTSATTSDARLDFDLPTGVIGNDNRNDMKYSPTVYNVLPNTGDDLEINGLTDANKKNTGFQVVLNYKLTAEDTEEVIHVKNARVYVSDLYTQWEPNYHYTYIFRITKNSTGNTEGTDPTPDPVDPDPALYPIIFDNLKVVETTTDFGKEWLINPKNPTDTNPVNQD